MHHLAYLATLYDKSGLHTFAGINQIMVYGTDSQQGWDGCMGFIHATVGENNIVVSVVYTLGSLLAEFVQSFVQSFFAFDGLKEHVELHGIEALVADILKNIQLGVGQDRMWQTHHLAIALIGVQNARTYATYVLGETHHKVLTDGVDGRVGNLCKLLTEVVKENLWLVGKYGKWSVITHGCCRLLALGSHRDDGSVDVFFAEAELQLFAGEIFHCVFHFTSAAELLQLDAVGVEPLTIRMLGCQTLLDFAIIVYLTFLGIDEQNLTRLQTTFLCHLRWVEVHYAYLGSHYHHVVLGDGVAGWAKTVTVEHTTSIASVAEE